MDKRREIIILDQENGRLQRLKRDGSISSSPLPPGAFEDVAIDARGRLVLLERLPDARLVFLRPDGDVSQSAPLAGVGIEQSGLVSALEPRSDGVWVEIASERMLRLTDVGGAVDASRPVVTGSLDAEAASLLAVRAHGASVELVKTDRRTGVRAIFSASVGGTAEAAQVLGEDPAGRYHVLVQHRREQQGEAVPVQSVLIFEAGTAIARAELNLPGAPLDQFRAVRLGVDGAIYQLVPEVDGAVLERISP